MLDEDKGTSPDYGKYDQIQPFLIGLKHRALLIIYKNAIFKLVKSEQLLFLFEQFKK